MDILDLYTKNNSIDCEVCRTFYDYNCLINKPQLDLYIYDGISKQATIEDLINIYGTLQDVINSFENIDDISNYKIRL